MKPYRARVWYSIRNSLDEMATVRQSELFYKLRISGRAGIWAAVWGAIGAALWESMQEELIETQL